MTLFLPVGPPGCGKSHLSETLRKRKVISEDSVISTDILRLQMTGSVLNQGSNDEVWSVARTMAHTRLKNGLTVYFDATNLNPDWYDKMLAVAKENDHRVLFIYFDTAYDLCRARNGDREGNAIPDVAVERMITQHAAIDTEDLKVHGDVLTTDGSVWNDRVDAIEAIQMWINGGDTS